MFEQIYSRMGGELQAMTKLIGLSKQFPEYLFVVVLIIATIAMPLFIFREKENIRSALSNILLKCGQSEA